MAIHPAMDLTIEGDEQARAIIAASINQFLAWASINGPAIPTRR